MKKVLKSAGSTIYKRASCGFIRVQSLISPALLVAYYLLISIFPLMLIAANILPYFHIRPTSDSFELTKVCQPPYIE